MATGAGRQRTGRRVSVRCWDGSGEDRGDWARPNGTGRRCVPCRFGRSADVFGRVGRGGGRPGAAGRSIPGRHRRMVPGPQRHHGVGLVDEQVARRPQQAGGVTRPRIQVPHPNQRPFVGCRQGRSTHRAVEPLAPRPLRSGCQLPAPLLCVVLRWPPPGISLYPPKRGRGRSEDAPPEATTGAVYAAAQARAARALIRPEPAAEDHWYSLTCFSEAASHAFRFRCTSGSISMSRSISTSESRQQGQSSLARAQSTAASCTQSSDGAHAAKFCRRRVGLRPDRTCCLVNTLQR